MRWPYLGCYLRGSVFDNATASLPPHLDHFSILDQDWNGALPTRDLKHAPARYRVGLHVVLDKLTALPFQSLAHFASVGAASRSIEFDHNVKANV